MEMPILFVGFSADDWNIRDYIAGIQHAFPDGLRRPHFAINLSSDSAALSRFQTNFACIGARVIDCSEDNPLRFTERLSEFLDQIAIDLSVARQGCDKSPSPADKTKPSVKQEAHVQRDPINIVTVGTLEHQRHEVAPTVTSLDEEDDIRTLIDDPSARLFVLSFGAVACGKTSLLGALVQGMQTPEAPGRLYVDYGLTTALRQGSYLWRTIELAFSQKAFPPRTAAGNTTRIRLEYLPESTVRASRCVINFLETSGEDFHSFQNGKHLRELPPHIQKYLMLPQSKFVFLLLCEWDHAARDDIAISDFISYVNRQEPNHFGKNFQVVFTKWDTRPEGASEATEIFRDHMPRTFNLLSQNSMAPLPFSVGTVIPFDGAPILAVTNHSYARSLFEIIYRQHTGRTTTPTSLSRVWSWLRDLG